MSRRTNRPGGRRTRAVLGALALGLLAACGSGVEDLRNLVDPDDGGCPAAQDQGGTGNGHHNLLVLNAYRACAGVPPLVLDPALSQYALVGSQQYAAGGPVHGHFNADPCPYPRSCSENQGWSYGQRGDFGEIDNILRLMWDEGPGGVHYDNIVNPAWTVVGIGIVVTSDGTLFLTNDFQ